MQGKAAPWYGGCPRPLRVALTFVFVLVTWVFFRAADLPSAVRYLGFMFGVGDVPAGARRCSAGSSTSRTTSARSWWRASSCGRVRRRGTGRARLTWPKGHAGDRSSISFWLLFLLAAGDADDAGFNPFIYFIF
jgi:alginate O-acetyltransferase complex protein AlgI